MDKKSILKTINDCNKELASQNIPYLSNSTNFTRTELHQFYIMYKALCHCTSQRYGIMEYGSCKFIPD